MADQAPDNALFLLDHRGKITHWNEAVPPPLGYCSEDVLQQSFAVFFVDKDRSNGKPQQLIDRVSQTGVVQHTGWWVRKDDSTFWGSITLTVLEQDNRSSPQWVGVLQDQTHLKKAQELLSLTHQVADIGSWELDLATNRLTWSPITRKIHEVPLDYEPNLETGINFYKEGESRDTIRRVVDEALQYGKPYDVRLIIVTAKGNERWVRAKGQPEMMNGRCIRLLGTFQDIHEEQLRSLRLAESEALLKEAQALSKIGSWEWDPTTNQVIWSDQMFDLLGLEKEKHTGTLQDIFPFIHPDDLERVRNITAQAIAEKRAIPIEYRIVTQDGVLKYIRGEGRHHIDAAGNLIRLSGTLQDISEQTSLQLRLDRYWNNSQELLCIANTDGYFLKLNPRWSEVLGYSEEELKSSTFLDFIHPDDREATLAEVAHLAEGQTTVNFINRYRTKSGVYRWLQWSSGVEPDEGLLFASARDITQRMEAEQELQRYNKQLEDKNTELEQFAYIASHDLQEPLRNMTSLVDLVVRQYTAQLDTRGKKTMQYISEASERMRQLVHGLLNYSRLGKGSSQGWVDCQQVVQLIEQDLALLLAESNARIRVVDLPTVKGYPTELRMLFQHLINNAIKFRRPGTPLVIRISAKRDQGFWRFSIQDNGIGIDPKHQERIFLIYQRLHKREAYAGTGIGLAHCRKIVQLHGGEIGVDAQLGIGSTFFFTLPVKSIK